MDKDDLEFSNKNTEIKVLESCFNIDNSNLEISLIGSDIHICLKVEKTIVNRIKYWMLCKILPFKIIYWN